MFRVSLLTLSVLSFIQLISCVDQAKTYTCEVIESPTELQLKDERYIKYFRNTTVCILDGLKATSSDKHFQVVTNHDSTNQVIDAVWIRNSSVKVLTDDICRTLPSIKVLVVKRQDLSSIDPDALKLCTKLEVIDLYLNSLSTLPEHVFHFNPALTKVFMAQNDLASLDENIFVNNVKLTQVVLRFNNLRSMPMTLFRNNANLEKLDISANELREVAFLASLPEKGRLTHLKLDINKLPDFDIETLLDEFPNLKRVHIDDNELWCERQDKIIEFVHSRKTSMSLLAFGPCIRDRKEWEATKNAINSE